MVAPGQDAALLHEMRKGLADHMRQERGIKPQPSDDSALVESDQVGRVVIVVGIHLSSIGTPEIVPPPFVNENLVPKAEVLVENI
jgi:hypothetical protein